MHLLSIFIITNNYQTIIIFYFNYSYLIIIISKLL